MWPWAAPPHTHTQSAIHSGWQLWPRVCRSIVLSYTRKLRIYSISTCPFAVGTGMVLQVRGPAAQGELMQHSI